MSKTQDVAQGKNIGVSINKKNLYGGANPDRRILNVNSLALDPLGEELDELGNPIDYFNIYKRKMAELAQQKFDKQKDHQFFDYLDRLVNAEEYRKKERIDGKGILREFVTEHSSLVYVKKRNEQVKRWELARKSRIELGLPADPPDVDPSLLQARLDALNRKQPPQVLK